MKRLITIVLLFVSIGVYGQALNNTYTKFPNGLAVGNGVTNKPTSSPSTGSIWYKTGTGFQVYNGTTWITLGEAGAGVTSFNSRTGAVVPLVGDYPFFPLYDGTGATGTWGIGITGNAGTVTNGVYTNGSYANPSWITSLAWAKITGAPTSFPTPNSLSTGYGLLGSSFDGGVARTFSADTASATGLVSKSRLATNLGGYVPITRTVAGFPLSSNVTLADFTAGYGLSWTPYNGSSPVTSTVDTTEVQTVDNFFPKGDTRYARTGSTGTVTNVSALTLGTTGTDLSSSVVNGTTTPVITLNVPDASATARGVINTGPQTIAGDKSLVGDSISIGKTAGTSGISLYGKVYMKNLTSGLSSDSILTVLNGRVRKIPVTSFESPLTFSTGLTRATNTVTINQAFSPTWTGTHTFASGTNGIVGTNRSSSTYASIFKVATAGTDNWAMGLPTAATTNWSLFNYGTNTDAITVNYTTNATTFSGSVTASSIVKSGGTSAQYLMADGSVTTSSANLWSKTGTALSPTTSGDYVSLTVPSSGTALEINANTGSSNGISIATTSGGYGTRINNSGTSYGLSINASGASSSGHEIVLGSTNGVGIYLNATSDYTGTPITYSKNGTTLFNVSNAGALTLGTTTGSLRLGTNVSDYGTLDYSGGSVSLLTNWASTSAILNLKANGVGLVVNGNSQVFNAANTTVFNVTSDKRVKENIRPLTWGLSSVLALKPSLFDYTDKFSLYRKLVKSTDIPGFIADEYEQVFPDYIEKSTDEKLGITDLKSIDLSPMVPVLVKAIQEQQALITALEARIKALEQ